LAEITMKPANEAVMTGDDAAKMQRLSDALEGLDDVQDVYSNAELSDDVLAGA
jgi:transcriptional/translational regulatory protein YebC/TACO1